VVLRGMGGDPFPVILVFLRETGYDRLFPVFSSKKSLKFCDGRIFLAFTSG
jgi:hypothetical protein